jgi:hypothetical protein
MTNFKPTRKVDSAKVACGEFFRLGVADYRAGQPWREIQRKMDATNYERGRHFAAIFSGQIYQGRGLNWQAKEVLRGAVSQRAIL